MRFGSRAWLRRGSIAPRDGVGGARFVAVRYRFARGGLAYCELLEDDPRALDARTAQAGQRGWWSREAVRPWTPCRPAAMAANYRGDR